MKRDRTQIVLGIVAVVAFALMLTIEALAARHSVPAISTALAEVENKAV